MKLKWSRKAPTEPGYYWFGKGDEIPAILLHVYYGSLNEGGSGLLATVNNVTYRADLLKGWWAKHEPVLTPKN